MRQVDHLRKKIFAHSALAMNRGSIISQVEFIKLCTSRTTIPPALAMTEGEAKNYMDSLCRACTLVKISDDTLCLSPRDVVNAVHTATGLPPLQHGLPLLRNHRAELLASISASAEENVPQTEAVVKREKDFWAAAALLSSVQMTVLSYLTFIVYGWDVMEPVCYFVTTATSLCAYAYFLRFRQEHSYESVDEHRVPHLLAEELQKVNFDIERYIDKVNSVSEIDEALSKDVHAIQSERVAAVRNK